MDPDAALATLTDPTYDTDERLDVGLALIRWMARGGYVPVPINSHQRSAAARHLAAIARVCDLIEQAR